MNREIKFRAWSYTNKVMYYRVLVGNTQTDDPCSSIWSEERKNWLNFDKSCGVIMQYIGLSDKEGKEIYEGDVVKCPITSVSANYLLLEADSKDYVIRNISMPECYQEDLPDDCEIIGNIFQNPELIKEKQWASLLS